MCENSQTAMPNIAITLAKQSDLIELCGCINLENVYNIMYIVRIIIIILYCKQFKFRKRPRPSLL